ncbi:MAG: VOC family protein [Proteobacteria bacterium]|nr:VOC family protein [Pseudomonadota bacterium]
MPAGSIKRINTILYCRNWETTVKFYRDVMKLMVNHETEWLVEFQLVDNTYLSIANTAGTSIQSSNGDGITLSFQVETVDVVHRQLREIGIETGPIKPIWGARAFYIFDPEGHRIELWSNLSFTPLIFKQGL